MLRILLGAALALALVSAADARPRLITCDDRTGCNDRPVAGEAMPAPQRAAGARLARLPSHAARSRRAHPAPALSPVEATLPPPAVRAVAEAVTEMATAPARFVRGRLICAANVNLALAERGLRGTGSRLAKSFLAWGRASGPVPGAVAVYGRRGGGHVAIVSHVDRAGRVWIWNPSARRQRWVLTPYRRALAYRVAS